MARIERNYTINLRRDFVKAPRYKRSKRAVNFVKSFLAKHLKSEDVKLGKHLNEYIWKNGIKNPPSRVSVTAIKEDDKVTAELIGKKYEEFKVQTQPNEEPTGLKGKLQQALKGKETEEQKEEEPEQEAKETKKEPETKEKPKTAKK